MYLCFQDHSFGIRIASLESGARRITHERPKSPGGFILTLKIQKRSDQPESMILFLSGRIRSKHLDELSALLEQVWLQIVFDLSEIILVDREAVVFLAACESKGIELRNCPAFIREWIRRERSHKAGADISSAEL
jgi:hypothetical protein